jgi:hypothetical protein
LTAVELLEEELTAVELLEEELTAVELVGVVVIVSQPPRQWPEL